MVVNDRIFNNIEKIMVENNITGKELSEHSKISEAQISYIKRGHKIPNQFTMLQICKAFNSLGVELDIKEIFELNHTNVNFMQ